MVSAKTFSIENVDRQSPTSVNAPKEDEKIIVSNPDSASLNTKLTNQDVQNGGDIQINRQKKQNFICSDRLINKKAFKQQNKICRNLTVISMMLCIAAVLALIATCYVKNMDKLPKIGLGLIAGMLFMVGTVSMVMWYQLPSDKLDSTKIKVIAYQALANN